MSSDYPPPPNDDDDDNDLPVTIIYQQHRQRQTQQHHTNTSSSSLRGARGGYRCSRCGQKKTNHNCSASTASIMTCSVGVQSASNVSVIVWGYTE